MGGDPVPSSNDNVSDLRDRISELEDTVRRLSAGRAPVKVVVKGKDISNLTPVGVYKEWHKSDLSYKTFKECYKFDYEKFEWYLQEEGISVKSRIPGKYHYNRADLTRIYLEFETRMQNGEHQKVIAKELGIPEKTASELLKRARLLAAKHAYVFFND